MADEQSTTMAPESKVYIVYTERTAPDETPEMLESKQLDLLASVLGSPEAAKEAVLYHYKHSVHGFSAKLTQEQAANLEALPDVLQVTESKTYHLHGGAASVQRT